MAKIKIAIADDHALMRMGLVNLLNDHQFQVIVNAENGKHLIDQLKDKSVDVVLMDISMPVMNGYEATHILHQTRPEIKVMALSTFGDDASVIRMIKSGAKGYLLKDTEPQILRNAIVQLAQHGVFYSDTLMGKMLGKMNGKLEKEIHSIVSLTEREIAFLLNTCTDLTMKEIAIKMQVSPRTVDGYRDHLFQKLNLQTRTGLVLYAIKNRVYVIE